MTSQRAEGSIRRGLLAGVRDAHSPAAVAGLSPGPARVAAGSAGGAPPFIRLRRVGSPGARCVRPLLKGKQEKRPATKPKTPPILRKGGGVKRVVVSSIAAAAA